MQNQLGRLNNYCHPNQPIKRWQISALIPSICGIDLNIPIPISALIPSIRGIDLIVLRSINALISSFCGIDLIILRPISALIPIICGIDIIIICRLFQRLQIQVHVNNIASAKQVYTLWPLGEHYFSLSMNLMWHYLMRMNQNVMFTACNSKKMLWLVDWLLVVHHHSHDQDIRSVSDQNVCQHQTVRVWIGYPFKYDLMISYAFNVIDHISLMMHAMQLYVKTHSIKSFWQIKEYICVLHFVC